MSHLHVVDTTTGEIKDDCESCRLLRAQLDGAEKDLRAWRSRYAELKRQVDENLEEDPLWNDALLVFKHWKAACNHPRSIFTADRFGLIRPLIDKYGIAACLRAVDGAAYDPMTKQRRNGSVKRFDDWELIFRNAGKLEDFANRAPIKTDGR